MTSMEVVFVHCEMAAVPTPGSETSSAAVPSSEEPQKMKLVLKIPKMIDEKKAMRVRKAITGVRGQQIEAIVVNTREQTCTIEGVFDPYLLLQSVKRLWFLGPRAGIQSYSQI